MGCRHSSHGSRPGESIDGEGVDGRNVGDGDALWKGHEDVALSLGANGRAVGGGASTGSEAWESLEGWLKSGRNARPVHSGGMEGQDGEAEALSEGSLELPALEFEGS
jgi:hypothetical protein